MTLSDNPVAVKLREIRAQRKLDGKCGQCNSPVQYPGAFRCATCQAAKMAKRSERVALGYCKDCWSHVRVNAHRCAECQHKKGVAQRSANAAAARVRRGRR